MVLALETSESLYRGQDAATAAESVKLITQADRDGLGLFTVADHPYFGAKLDACALASFLLGQTQRITGMVTVTNLPSRPAPVLARTITSLSALSGAGSCWGPGPGRCGTWTPAGSAALTLATMGSWRAAPFQASWPADLAAARHPW